MSSRGYRRVLRTLVQRNTDIGVTIQREGRFLADDALLVVAMDVLSHLETLFDNNDPSSSQSSRWKYNDWIHIGWLSYPRNFYHKWNMIFRSDDDQSAQKNIMCSKH